MKQNLLAGALCAVAVSASAHHAMEYIEMESYATARRGASVLHLHYDYFVDDRDNPDLDHWEFTPGISYGITERLMADVHAHFAGFGIDHIVADQRARYASNGPSPFVEAAAASLQYRLVADGRLDVAVVVGMEVPFHRAEFLLGCEDNVYSGMLIVGRTFGEHSNLTLNLGYEEEGDEDETTWALGFKTPVSADPHGIAAGVEVRGALEDTGDNWSVLPGVYMPIASRHITLKTGLEFGQQDGADARRANITLMSRF